ncbi:hypothetical protein V1478_014358 [Vespula squamosa]|uniref:Uncharacterized protein n=1 Tax=Vespula squamosa TaxID=30214 RepID=A0ABD2A828_VESSQ
MEVASKWFRVSDDFHIEEHDAIGVMDHDKATVHTVRSFLKRSTSLCFAKDYASETTSHEKITRCTG